jgi:hypothetical protein
MQKFDTPAPISAVLDIPAGRVRLIAVDRADTTVEVLPADASKGRDVKAAEQTKVVYGDAVLLRTQSGDISVGAAAGVSAALDAGTGYGRISNALKNDGTAGLDIHATTYHGDIAARSL